MGQERPGAFQDLQGRRGVARRHLDHQVFTGLPHLGLGPFDVQRTLVVIALIPAENQNVWGATAQPLQA